MGNRVGVIAGNFDVIHPGYIHTFKECKKHCDKFVILLHVDPSIERPNKMKPILSVDERMDMLLSLEMIDEVLFYNTEDELYNLLKTGNYHVRFLGEDYIGATFTGADLNIKLYFINRDHGWSTTKYKKLISESVLNNQKTMETSNTPQPITKAGIVTRLLTEKQISAEEAVVLLKDEPQQQPYAPFPTPYPTQPYIPPYNVPYCSCGNDGTKPCWSTSCPKRLIVTYCSTSTNTPK